jgi:hypothetical protein
MALSKFCPGCGVQHQERGAFHSIDCHKDYRKRKRDELAKKKCRHCGRPWKAERVEEWKEFREWKKMREKSVDSEHSSVQESLHV